MKVFVFIFLGLSMSSCLSTDCPQETTKITDEKDGSFQNDVGVEADAPKSEKDASIHDGMEPSADTSKNGDTSGDPQDTTEDMTPSESGFKRIVTGETVNLEKGRRFTDFTTPLTIELDSGSESELRDALEQARNKSGATIHLFDGVIEVESTLKVPSNVKLIGKANTKIKQTSGLGMLFDFRESQKNIVFESFEIDGGNNGSTIALSFYQGGFKNIKITKMHIHNFGRSCVSFNGGQSENSYNKGRANHIEVTWNHIHNCGGDGSYSTGYHGIEGAFWEDVLVASNDVHNCGMGIDMSIGSKRIETIGNKISDCYYGSKAPGSEDVTLAYNDYVGTFRYGDSNSLFYSYVYPESRHSLRRVKNLKVIGNNFSTATTPASTTGSFTSVDGLTIRDNLLSGGKPFGISDCTNVTNEGNH